MLKSSIKKLVNRFGYDIQHLPTDPLVRKRTEFLKIHHIDLIFDIGANTGQFAMNIRKMGYEGKIVSFEPLPDAYTKLIENSANDIHWEAVNLAIGNENNEVNLHISKNSYSSSVLDILPRHVESAPDSVYVDIVKVPIRKIDSIIDKYFQKENQLLLKIDTQGLEKQVFEGCLNSLDKIKGFQIEMSLLPLYRGETLMHEMIDLMRNYGYRLVLLEAGHQDYTTGEILQFEGVFYR